MSCGIFVCASAFLIVNGDYGEIDGDEIKPFRRYIFKDT